MKLEIIAVYDKLDAYIVETQKENPDYEALWEQYAIEPYWSQLTQDAPMDLSDRKPKAIRDIPRLKQIIAELKAQINLEELKESFLQVAQALQSFDDSPMMIALFPLYEEEPGFIEQHQNGVAGTCIWGNMLININPKGKDFTKWIPYVFAHEYHHNIWGGYWYVTHGGASGKFIETLLIDGQADTFAKSLYPFLYPSWISQLSAEEEKRLWKKYYQKLIDQTEVDFPKYMFGNFEDIPWCSGYFFGYRIIESYLRNNPPIDTKALLELDCQTIYEKSGYMPKQDELINQFTCRE
jgi:uncharacterized protein YjaZ